MKNVNSFLGISNNIKLTIKIFVIVLMFFYFAFHVVNGENGFVSYIEIKKELEPSIQKLQKIQHEYEQMKRRVKLLSDTSLDLDLLEERARVILNYCYPNEIIVKRSNIIN